MPQNFGYIRINPLNIDHLKEFKKIDLDKLFIDQYNSSKPNQELENLLDLIQPEDELIRKAMSVEGASYRSVAKQFNVGIATVQRAMKKDI